MNTAVKTFKKEIYIIITTKIISNHRFTDLLLSCSLQVDKFPYTVSVNKKHFACYGVTVVRYEFRKKEND